MGRKASERAGTPNVRVGLPRLRVFCFCGKGGVGFRLLVVGAHNVCILAQVSLNLLPVSGLAQEKTERCVGLERSGWAIGEGTTGRTRRDLIRGNLGGYLGL